MLRGQVVVAHFWTFTCINWLRTAPYLLAWSRAYRNDGLVVIGVHTPEFGFEHDIDRVREATRERRIDYPVAVDNGSRIWDAFNNSFWPARYLLDQEGIVRDHHFGEGSYEKSERALQRLLGIERELITVEGRGVEADADWAHLRTSETYLGFGQSAGLPSWPSSDDAARLRIGEWSFGGKWDIGPEKITLARASGSLAMRFHARDAHLVMSPGGHGPIRFRVSLDGQSPGRSHGVDVDEDGNGTVQTGRLYQLVRTDRSVRDRTLRIWFADPGVDAYSFTFG